ncbi:hypothetical protein K1T71_007706 [Dendrolimus kikuchii]|uniref:Uncharacterized protein n=1 Tax=Dendrolimus kikuchii TaxID=765133 RepID=A0ACC1CZG1_9NEOP|nr:hypothetical protein K1T71_007706 [Dendrolimus kikuchii]
MGSFPDAFYLNLRDIPLASAILGNEQEDIDIEDVIQFHANVVVMNCKNFEQFEDVFFKTKESPYYHPLSNIIMYYHNERETLDQIAKIFFVFWYYRVFNGIIVQYSDTDELLRISYYNPYVFEHYKLDNNYGCWTTKKIGMTIVSYQESFTCVEGCQNVSKHSKLRSNHLGTCLGFNTITISYFNRDQIKKFNPFPNKAKDLHGFPMRAYATEVPPFLTVKEDENGNVTIHSRDGIIWSNLAMLMNFTFDYSLNEGTSKKVFIFERNIQHIFAFSQRKGDLFILPIYQFEITILDIEHTFPYKDSGVCFLSHRADFETITLDLKSIQSGLGFIFQLLLCFLFIWLLFCLYNLAEKGMLSLDQIGKDFLNTFRNILLIALYKPPNRQTFRILLAFSIWGFFIMSFGTQAAVISFFTAVKRGKEVETYEDIIEKGYPIQGLASPDAVLPDDDERFRKISAKLEPITDIFLCVKALSYNKKLFCLVDCAVARYYQRNRLNEHGEQYLHVARDRIHSHYLEMILHRHSGLTEEVNKYMIIFVEAGLVRKWEEYRFNNIKEDPPVSPLSMEDFKGVLVGFCLGVGFTSFIFITELFLGNRSRRKYCMKLIGCWNLLIRKDRVK